jgi:L-ascorbate metabolism protein UlaG (beta-lactamase superfamily)
MEITWYGLSCFRIVERGSVTVITDPFDHNVAGYAPLKLKGDIVTISHDAPAYNHVAAVKGDPYVISGPGEYEIGGVFVTGVHTNGRRRAADEPYNTLYVIKFEELSVAHLGDLRRAPSQTEVEALGQVDVALVPVGGEGGLTPAKAAEVISILEPGIVIPMHYQTPQTTLKLLPLNRFLKEMGVERADPQPAVKVDKGSIPEETRVIVLEPHM